MKIPARLPDLTHWKAQVKCQLGCPVRTDAGRSAACFVADHRTRAWLARDAAIYLRSSIATPMGSHLTAYADEASAAADPAARDGSLLSAPQVFGPPGASSTREAR
jgi:hypothetical protein